jgi:periplasmic divalent cation tolerance protein
MPPARRTAAVPAQAPNDPVPPVLVCFCACPDAGTAARIADALVAERLAACVNMLPGVRSVYRWKGAVERADEVLLLIKSTHERLAALSARIVALHPYELPEVLAVDAAGGLPGYLDWLAAQTTPGP